MSFGVFEASLGSETEVGMARQASADKLATAVYDVRDKLGGFYFQAASLEEFRDRVAMTKNDQSLFKVIEASGLHPATGIVRRIAGKNSILEDEFKQRLAAGGSLSAEGTNPEGIGTSQVPGAGTPMSPSLTDPVSGVPQTVSNPPPAPQTTLAPGNNGAADNSISRNLFNGNRRRGDFEGVQDIDSTFSKDEQGKELKPKDDWEGYLNSVDQDAPSKVKRNFASKEAWNLYRAWCDTHNKSAARISSLDAYAANLNDTQYLKLANTILAWENDHKPKVPNTKLDKRDKVSARYPHPGDEQDGWDLKAPTSLPDKSRGKVEEEPHHPGYGGDFNPRGAMRRYVAWCDRNGYSKVAKSTIDHYVSRVGGQHTNYMAEDNPQWDNFVENSTVRRPAELEKNGLEKLRVKRDLNALRKHLYAQVATTIRWARTQRVACWPGCHENEAHVKKVHKDKEASRRQGGDDSFYDDNEAYNKASEDELHRRHKERGGEGNADPREFWKGGRRRTAAPDYLQKADDALTQLLNQKAEEFQQTIQPLQQALQTVQQAEQLQQQANPLNVLPPAGTVNVMPGGGAGGAPSTADQVGMPDPNSQDTSGLAALLSGVGGTAPNDAPMGGGQGAPPPAAEGQGALPPEMDPNQPQQMAASRKRGGLPKGGRQQIASDWEEPEENRRVRDWMDQHHETHPTPDDKLRGLYEEGLTKWSPDTGFRGRQAAGVGEQFDSWKNRKNQQGDLLRGGDPDYEQFANETGVGERAMNKLKQRNQTPDFAPINRPELQGVTVGKRKRSNAENGTSDDFYTPAAGHEYHDPAQQNGWKMTHSDDDGNASWSHPTGHSVTGRDGPTGGSWQLHGPQGPMGHPHRSPEDAQRSMPRQAARKKARGARSPQRRSFYKGAPFAGYEDFDDCTSKNSDKDQPDAYCGEIKHRTEDKKQGRRKRANPSAVMDTGRHSIDDPDNSHDAILNPTSPYTGGSMFDDAPDLTPTASRRKQARQKTSWSGWGPAQFPKTRKVAGWEWNDGLQAYLASAPRIFTCGCGHEHETPNGYQRCKCGKAYNSYVIGTGGNNKEAAAEKFLVREIPVRENVIVGSRRKKKDAGRHDDPLSPDNYDEFTHIREPAELNTVGGYPGMARDLGPAAKHRPRHQATVELVDPRTGNIHRLIDPGELHEGEDPGHSTFKKPSTDWSKRMPPKGNPGQWSGSSIG